MTALQRFSRDLHDLLGHTLSVIVIKAEAVRRFAPADPAAAVEHARVIEEIGRTALVEVRQAVVEREREILAASDGGTPITELAAGLHLSPSRVRHYLSSAIEKTGARNHAEARHTARREGWL